MFKKDCEVLFFICALTLTIGFLYLNLGHIFPVVSDAAYYDGIALNLLLGKGFLPSGGSAELVYPGYPLFLALVYKIFGHNYQAVRIIQFLILSGIGILAYFSARRLKINRPLAIAASSLIIIWPYFILYSTLILTEILFTFFLVLSVFFLLKFQETPSNNNAAFAGAFLGITALIKPAVIFLPIWVIILSWLFLSQKFLKKYFLIFLLFIIVLSPWFIRNIIRFQVPLPEIIGIIKVSQEDPSRESGLVNFLESGAKNAVYFWNPGAQGIWTQALITNYPWATNLFFIYKICFFIIIGLAFISLRLIKKNGEIFLLWVIISYFWAIHMIFTPSPRHTLPVIPLLILLSALTVNHFLPFFPQDKNYGKEP